MKIEICSFVFLSYDVRTVRDIEGLRYLLASDLEVMETGTKLKVISNYAVGYNNIDLDAACAS
jgi:lactate dehydrogenase-like 2-hydroxyacid dehydrogenase